MLRHYYADTAGYIIVVDANDQERMPDVVDTEILKFFAEDLLKSVPLLVFANKKDLPFVIPTAELATKLGLDTPPLPHSHRWHIEPCCAPTGAGLYEGLLWLREAIRVPV